MSPGRLGSRAGLGVEHGSREHGGWRLEAGGVGVGVGVRFSHSVARYEVLRSYAVTVAARPHRHQKLINQHRGVLGACLCTVGVGTLYAGNLPHLGGYHRRGEGVASAIVWWALNGRRNGDGADGLSTARFGLLTHGTAHMHEDLLESGTAEQQARYWTVQLHLHIYRV